MCRIGKEQGADSHVAEDHIVDIDIILHFLYFVNIPLVYLLFLVLRLDIVTGISFIPPQNVITHGPRFY